MHSVRRVAPGLNRTRAVLIPARRLSGLPAMAPGGLPLVGHSLNFKPEQLLQYIDKLSGEMNTSTFMFSLGPRKILMVGDPELAQAITNNPAWANRGSAKSPVVMDSDRDIVGPKQAGDDPSPAGMVFGNGPVAHAVPRKAAEEVSLMYTYI